MKRFGRESDRYIGSLNQKQFAQELKAVYQAFTKEEALYELDKLEEKWGKKYPIVFQSWRNKWENLTVYFQYPEDIRRVIYTSASLNLNYKIIDPLSLNTNIRYIGRQYEDSSNNDKVEDYTLVDLGLSYDITKNFTLYGGIDNIFNRKVDTNVDINVGTYYFTGLRAKF